MSWKLGYNEKLGIIELVIQGSYSREEMMESTIEVIKFQEQMERLRILVDARASNPDMPLVDLFDFPDQIYEKQGANKRNILALLPARSAKGRKDSEFWVNACVNRGWLVQMSDSREEAIAWLVKPGDSLPE